MVVFDTVLLFAHELQPIINPLSKQLTAGELLHLLQDEYEEKWDEETEEAENDVAGANSSSWAGWL